MSATIACLALAVYFEARSEPVAGQLAVAQVVLNRVKDKRYPNDACEVIFQSAQFSFYWDGLPDTPREAAAWEQAKLIASAALAGSGDVQLEGATHYHATYVDPWWAPSYELVATIGAHKFYRSET